MNHKPSQSGKPRVFHIRGGGFRNKGAELMLVSTINWIRANFEDALIGIPYQTGTVEQRRAVGLKDVFWAETPKVSASINAYHKLALLNRKRGQKPDAAVRALLRPGDHRESLAKRSLRRLRQLDIARSEETILGPDVDVVLDISGFAYGDSWGPRNARISSNYYAYIKENGGKVVLLSQQMGPFEHVAVRDAFCRMVAHCDLIVARDSISYEVVSTTCGPQEGALCLYPDFTVLQEGRPDHGVDVGRKACIVPNYRMQIETSDDVSTSYVPFMVDCIRLLGDKGVGSVVVVHEDDPKDVELASGIAQAAGVEVVRETDPLRLKGILGAAYVTVGSRFHGLVSALSQGVPSLGTGWSHKYRMLFSDYESEDHLVDVRIDRSLLADKLASITDPKQNKAERAKLKRMAERHKGEVVKMWEEVSRVLS
jgi:polysaccharide pyruvyl transferase WcaK-like protein